MTIINKRNVKIHNAHNKLLCGDFDGCIDLLEEAIADNDYDKGAEEYIKRMYRYMSKDKINNNKISTLLEELIK